MILKNAPIQKKLMSIILLVCGVVSVLTCAAFFAYELVTFRQDTVRRLSTLGEIIADNSTAALVFGDQENAREILMALAAERYIVVASLYDENGELFTSFPDSLARADLPATPGDKGYYFADRHLAGFQPVIENGKHLGTLYLRFDMRAMYERLKLYSALVLTVMLVSLLVAYVLSRNLQRQISRPILALAETAKAISERRDYSVRATKSSDDELGLLTDAFNQMLVQIHGQDRRLRESEERNRLMVANVQDYAIIMLDPSGRVVTWNAGAERIKGYCADEILGEHFSRFHSNEDVASGKPERHLQIATAAGHFEYESWLVRKDSSRFCANIVLTALRDEKGQLRGFSQVTRDITERKRTEEQVMRLNAELEERVAERTSELEAANKELEAFCYSVSHDLRAPLRTVHGFSRALMEDAGPALGINERGHIDRICAATTRMGDLIDSLLYLSRLTRDEMKKETVDLTLMVSSICDELQNSQPERRATWRIAANIKVRADRQLLHVALVNLLNNAWKYTGKKSQTEIEFGTTIHDGETAYFIRDNGAGFDMAYSENLFGAFQRLHNPREFEGIGIGLATVQRVIHRHGGRVWAEAEIEKGATFYFTL